MTSLAAAYIVITDRLYLYYEADFLTCCGPVCQPAPKLVRLVVRLPMSPQGNGSNDKKQVQKALIVSLDGQTRGSRRDDPSTAGDHSKFLT